MLALLASGGRKSSECARSGFTQRAQREGGAQRIVLRRSRYLVRAKPQRRQEVAQQIKAVLHLRALASWREKIQATSPQQFASAFSFPPRPLRETTPTTATNAALCLSKNRFPTKPWLRHGSPMLSTLAPACQSRTNPKDHSAGSEVDTPGQPAPRETAVFRASAGMAAFLKDPGCAVHASITMARNALPFARLCTRRAPVLAINSVEWTFAMASGLAETSASCPASLRNGASEAEKDPGKTGGRKQM